MRDSIYTIPISEVFEPKCGCPICSMCDVLEDRCIEYIMGAAMMEPDVRQETNKQGFCKTHFDMMMKKQNRLSLALILESLLIELPDHKLKKDSIVDKIKNKKGTPPTQSCFVCNKIDWAKERMFSTVLKMYEQSEDFRKLFKEQECICFPHYEQLVYFAKQHMNKKILNEFLDVCLTLCKKQLAVLQNDVSHYCKMFDYRNNSEGADWANSKDSIERTIHFLTSRKI